jgi:hypothetical protein
VIELEKQINLIALTRDTLRELRDNEWPLILTGDLQRRGYHPSETRSAFNAAIDKLDILHSKLYEIRLPSDDR